MLIFMLILVHGSLSVAVLGAHGALGAKSSGGELSKHAPFECGFSAKMPARAPVSLQFFLIALIFLVFDMELILLFPALSGPIALTGWKLGGLIGFLSVVTASTFLEWSQSMLEWVK